MVAASTSKHPLDQLDEDEIRAAAAAVKAAFGETAIRFVVVTLHEPDKATLAAFADGGPSPPRTADAILIVPTTGLAYEVRVELPAGTVTRQLQLPPGTQPAFSPDDCFLAEEIVKKDVHVCELVRERYGIEDLSLLACDPWSVHIASKDYRPLRWRDDGVPARLVQTFLYRRDDADDNHYAHPLDILPVVDLNAQRVVAVEGEKRPAPKVPSASVNYHRNKLASNSYMQTMWRSDVLKPFQVTQPEGASYTVEGSLVRWQKWSLRVGFNYREGLVLHDVRYEGRSVLSRASIVEMAVPYGDPHPPFQSKCAFDVGDYGLGFCANSLALGCDCLGHIHYFDAVLSDSKGEPYVVSKAVCMHEEDAGLLWKHVEYRNGHSEARRSRRLVLSFIATVVNYEYLVYWYLMQDGSIEFEMKLSGELSTNALSEGEVEPEYGVLVAPGVNAQIHQHMFCARLDMAVDGARNCISELDIVAQPPGPKNPYGNVFKAVATPLKTEGEAQRSAAPARSWKVYNPQVVNKANGKPVAYKLVPCTRGPVMPPLLTSPECAVTVRGQFATKALWVTPYHPEERYPAGEYPTQSTSSEGLPVWCAANRSVHDEDIVLWHSFGVSHVPRVEDFPVMPCEMTGFSLKPDGFFDGNPAIDLAPEVNTASKCCSHKE